MVAKKAKTAYNEETNRNICSKNADEWAG